MKKFIPLLIVTALFATSCGVYTGLTRESQYAKMYEMAPVTLLVMPPINNTTHVEAKDLLFTSISRPLAEAGYYVISPLLTMDILRAESAYDAELFIDRPLNIFREYFGADAVVFSKIDKWNKSGTGIDTKITYIIKSTINDEVLFERTCDLYLDLSVETGSNSLLGSLVDLAASVIVTAATDHIKAARMANNYIFRDIPRGLYHPMYMQDMEEPAEEKDIKKTVKD